MDIIIRMAEPADAAALAGLIRGLDLFAAVRAETEDETRARVAEHLAQCLADASHSLYVAVEPDGGLLGYVAVHWLPYLILAGPEGYVSELFVAEAARGAGVGTRLLEVVEQAARARGCKRLMLLNMRERESYQRGFYKSHGWEERPGAANFVYWLR